MMSTEVESINRKYESSQELAKQHQESLEKELNFGKIKADDLRDLQVRLIDVTREKYGSEIKFKDLKDMLANARNGLCMES